jgi:AraC-like DNA-binding protein
MEEGMAYVMVINSRNYVNYNYILPYIGYCAEDKYSQPWKLEKRTIGTYEFVFITQGTGRFHFEDRTCDVKPNDLLLFKPGVDHSGHSATLPFHFLCMHFDLYASDKANDLQIVRHHFYESAPSRPVDFAKASFDFPEYTAVADSSYIHLLLRRILNESLWQYPGFGSIIKATFIDLLVNLFRQKEGTFGDKTYSPEVQAAVEYIKQNFRKRIFLHDLADHVHLQPTYLCSLFKKQTGQSISEYIRVYRISIAKSLLLDTDRKIDDIAAHAGFYDLHHFSRNFKGQVGLTPVQYRQMKR